MKKTDVVDAAHALGAARLDPALLAAWASKFGSILLTDVSGLETDARRATTARMYCLHALAAYGDLILSVQRLLASTACSTSTPAPVVFGRLLHLQKELLAASQRSANAAVGFAAMSDACLKTDEPKEREQLIKGFFAQAQAEAHDQKSLYEQLLVNLMKKTGGGVAGPGEEERGGDDEPGDPRVN